MPAEPLLLMTRRGCHLCDLVSGPLEQLAMARGLQLLVYDIDSDPDLRAQYHERVPVLLWGRRVLAEGRFDPGSIRELRAAASSSSTIP
jgi:hypothetical protein